MPLLLLLTPLLYKVQSLTVRLGIFTGRGFCELIRARFGPALAWCAVGGLLIAVAGTLVTELTAVAGVGEMFGLARAYTLPPTALLLIVLVCSGAWRRVELLALGIGLLELAFFVVAWQARPDWSVLLHHATDLPWHNHGFLLLAVALVGAVFNPWMIYYQQSAVAGKGLTTADYAAARWDTAMGAILTQCLTGAILVAAAASTLSGQPLVLTVIGDISKLLTPVMGQSMGVWVFGLGVLGASLVAAIVASVALAWGLAEAAGLSAAKQEHTLSAPGFRAAYVILIVLCVLLVCRVPDLIWLNITTQIVNTLLLPLVMLLLVWLARRTLPSEQQPGTGWALGLVVVSLLAGLSALSGQIGS